MTLVAEHTAPLFCEVLPERLIFGSGILFLKVQKSVNSNHIRSLVLIGARSDGLGSCIQVENAAKSLRVQNKKWGELPVSHGQHSFQLRLQNPEKMARNEDWVFG